VSQDNWLLFVGFTEMPMSWVVAACATNCIDFQLGAEGRRQCSERQLLAPCLSIGVWRLEDLKVEVLHPHSA
jgi:hypothetical protein